MVQIFLRHTLVTHDFIELIGITITEHDTTETPVTLYWLEHYTTL
jgi:hypothetical protein